MAVYTRHRLSAHQPALVPLEVFPSIERASRALQLRSTRQASRAYFFADCPPGGSGPGQEVAFPEADSTGHMAVWLRGLSDGPPGQAQPDELWCLSPRGAVRRQPWDAVAHDLDGATTLTGVVPDAVLQSLMTPAQRRAQALAYARQLPPIADRLVSALGPGGLRFLRDLIADDETLDAVLRMVQAAPE